MIASRTSIPPADFCCPITKKIMTDPVITPQGISYEREAIIHWLQNRSASHGCCPVTDAVTPIKSLRTNTSLSWKIKYWQTKNAERDNNHDDIVTDSKRAKNTPPKRFICPLTGNIMKDPVMTRAGHSFEREAIGAWFLKNGKVCPVSGKPLGYSGIIGNTKLKRDIELWTANESKPRRPEMSASIEVVAESKLDNIESSLNSDPPSRPAEDEKSKAKESKTTLEEKPIFQQHPVKLSTPSSIRSFPASCQRSASTYAVMDLIRAGSSYHSILTSSAVPGKPVQLQDIVDIIDQVDETLLDETGW